LSHFLELNKLAYHIISKIAIHDALIYSIPKNDSIHLSLWRALIQKTGPECFQYFNMAAAIEQQLKRPPTDYLEAVEAAKKISYKNADQYQS